MQEKKYYWLKLKRDFFKRHDIRIVEEMPNGKEYILFYLKLLCESVDHEGYLRFSQTIPYSAEMLSTITNTNIDIVKNAVKIFTDLGMMEVQTDGTLFMQEVERMIGSASETDAAIRKRRQREREKEAQKLLERDTFVTSCDISVTKDHESKSKSIEKELEIEKEVKRKRFIPPTLEEVQAYCTERQNDVDAERFIDYYTANGWTQGKGKPVKDWKACVRTWERSGYEKPKRKEVLPEYYGKQETEKATDAQRAEAQKWIERLKKNG